MINSRSTDDLTIRAQRYFEAFKEDMETNGLIYGLDWGVSSTYRDQEYQDHLFSLGRTHPGPIVTHTRYSNHSKRLAWDIYFMSHGKADWDVAKCDVDDDELPDYQEAAMIAKSLGLDAGYFWKKKDPCHIAVPEELA